MKVLALAMLLAQSAGSAAEQVPGDLWSKREVETAVGADKSDQPLRAVTRRSDAVLAPKVLNAAAPCSSPRVNGSMMDGGFPAGDHLSRLRVRNGTASYAFVKVIDAEQGLIATMYLDQGGQGAISHIPNGTYQVKFAFGGRLLAECQELAGAERALAFDTPIAFRAVKIVTDTAEGTLTRWSASDVEVTLFGVPEGEAKTRRIPLSDFNED